MNHFGECFHLFMTMYILETIQYDNTCNTNKDCYFVAAECLQSFRSSEDA